MNKKDVNVLVFTNDTASRHWRFDGIASRINRLTNGAMYVTSWKKWDGSTLGADVVVLEMLTSLEMVRECHKQGARVIFEADDAYIDSYGRERKNLQHISGKWREDAIQTVKECDAITVTTWRLAEHFRQFTDKPIYILPNYLDRDWYGEPIALPKRATDEIRIGWFGSKGHYEDLRMVVDALKEVIEEEPRAKLVYMGYGGMSSDKASTEVGWGEDVFKEIPRSRREFYRPVEAEFWGEKHRLLSLDIGIAPLVDDFFNHCKSNIKWIEYTETGVPCVVSPTVYCEHPVFKNVSTVKEEVTALVANTKEEWKNAILYLVRNESERKRIAENAREEVNKNWVLDHQWVDWYSVYLRTANGVI